MRRDVKRSTEFGALLPAPRTVRFGISETGFKVSSMEISGLVSRSCNPARDDRANEAVMDGWRKSPSMRHVDPWRDRASARLVATVVFPSPGNAEVIRMLFNGGPFGESGMRMLVS